jgi:aminopeptidase N
MDEGFNTFIDIYESGDFNHGEFAPKRDAEYAPGGGNPADEILPTLADERAPPILTRADTIVETYRHPVTYFKTALGLVLLREQILGPDRFDPAFRQYIRAWAFRHPQPDDFFRAMDSAAGEDLSYFWRGWFAENWTLDLAVDAIKAEKGGPTTITVGSHDKLVLPATLRVEFADGSHQDFRLPAESWIRNTSTSVTIPAGKAVAGATVDPDHKLPDKNRSNDSAKASAF